VDVEVPTTDVVVVDETDVEVDVVAGTLLVVVDDVVLVVVIIVLVVVCRVVLVVVVLVEVVAAGRLELLEVLLDVLVEVVLDVVRLVLVELLVLLLVLVVVEELVLEVVDVLVVLVGNVVVVEAVLENPTIWKMTFAGTPSDVVTNRSLLSRSTSRPSGPALKLTSFASPNPCAKRTSMGFRVPSCGLHVGVQLGSTNGMPVAGSISMMRSSPSVYDTYMRSPWNGAGRNCTCPSPP